MTSLNAHLPVVDAAGAVQEVAEMLVKLLGAAARLQLKCAAVQQVATELPQNKQLLSCPDVSGCSKHVADMNNLCRSVEAERALDGSVVRNSADCGPAAQCVQKQLKKCKHQPKRHPTSKDCFASCKQLCVQHPAGPNTRQ